MTTRALVSYHFHRDTDLEELRARLGGDVDFFADSGAYSAANSGATINLADYAAWLRHWDPLLTVQSTLDVIGDPAATAANTEALQELGCAPLPVFHVGTPWYVLERLCADHPYVALGGMARLAVGGAKQKMLMPWLIKCFRIARGHGTVFHGFGLTSPRIVQQLPFYSVDSSGYTFGQRFGMVYLWDADAWSMRSVFFRNPEDVRPHAALIHRHGIAPGRTINPDFMRPDTPTMQADRTAITAVSARAYLLMEKSLTRRHRTPPPPLPRHSTPGTKVYLAVSGASDKEIDPLTHLDLTRRLP